MMSTVGRKHDDGRERKTIFVIIASGDEAEDGRKHGLLQVVRSE